MRTWTCDFTSDYDRTEEQINNLREYRTELEHRLNQEQERIAWVDAEIERLSNLDKEND